MRVVLEDEQVVFGRELDETTTSLCGKRSAGRILERRDHVQERRTPAPAQVRVERVDVEPAFVAPHGRNSAPSEPRILSGRS